MKNIILNNKENSKKENAIIRNIKYSELDKILNLQDKILKDIDKSMYAKTSREEFRYYFDTDSIIIGCFAKEESLIAFGIGAKYGMSEHNYAYELGVIGSNLDKNIQIDTVAVEKSFRGNKLQNIICEIIENIAKTQNYENILATVHPENKYSLNVFLNLGYQIKKKTIMYTNLERYILSKEII